jgi:hypothetical protein
MEKKFYELSHDYIILIHNILGQFVSDTMKIGKNKSERIFASYFYQ